ncbi:MAG: hypothetical protein H6699_02275 [Myxococcales bacterium]|nr:hypothetical protein [Myxococcales bacterium]
MRSKKRPALSAVTSRLWLIGLAMLSACDPDACNQAIGADDNEEVACQSSIGPVLQACDRAAQVNVAEGVAADLRVPLHRLPFDRKTEFWFEVVGCPGGDVSATIDGIGSGPLYEFDACPAGRVDEALATNQLQLPPGGTTRFELPSDGRRLFVATLLRTSSIGCYADVRFTVDCPDTPPVCEPGPTDTADAAPASGLHIGAPPFALSSPLEPPRARKSWSSAPATRSRWCLRPARPSDWVLPLGPSQAAPTSSRPERTAQLGSRLAARAAVRSLWSTPVTHARSRRRPSTSWQALDAPTCRPRRSLSSSTHRAQSSSTR